VIAVFLNNKLISCDSIVPLLLEIRSRSTQAIRVFTLDAETYDAIRRNVVLWDAIRKAGKLVLLGRRRRGAASWLRHRLRMSVVLGGLALVALSGRAYFIHFRVLSDPTLAWLGRINRRRTFFCESDSWGESDLMRRVTELSAPRRRSRRAPVGDNLIAFQRGWSWLGDSSAAQRESYLFGPTRVRRIWIDHVRAVAPAYFRREFAAAGVPDQDEILAFMLGYMGPLPYLREPDTTRRLFAETLRELVSAAGGRPVMLKPHVITDAAVVEAEVVKYPRGSVLVTHLHPSVLAIRARLVVANYYSTTLADVFHFNVPTIEYTDYSEGALEITGGGSMRPEYVTHFINGDRSRFRAAIAEIMTRPRQPLPAGREGDASGLLARLCGEDRMAKMTDVRTA
jgi:hypothetical protein